MSLLLRYFFYLFLIKPFVYLVMGLNIRNRRGLPKKGPAIIVSNHNSHLDTMVLMSLLPTTLLNKTRPVAAADYFLKTKLLSWFSRRVISIIPIDRGGVTKGKDPFELCQQHLDKKGLLVLFPEGSRGEPEEMAHLKKGIAHLARNNPKIPVYPVFMHGLGKALPKGEFLPVPFIVDVFVGDPIYGNDDIQQFMNQLKTEIDDLKSQLVIQDWD